MEPNPEFIQWYDYDEYGIEWMVVSCVYWGGPLGREQSRIAVLTGATIETA